MRSSGISTCLFVTCAVVVLFSVTEGKSLQSADSYCPPERTTCSFGCCSYPNGTCCSNGFHCCRELEVCGSEPGQCLGLEEGGKMVRRQASPLYFPASPTDGPTACPPCTTRCGEDKCCFFRDGTCCEDGLHCCPYRYSCDMTQHLCHFTVQNEVTNLLESSDSARNSTLPVATMLKALDNEEYIECPGGAARCPVQYATCCEDPDYGFVTCCYNIFGVTRPMLHPIMSEYDVC